MEINKNFLNSITPALTQLKNIIDEEFVVFGSAPLYLLGIVDFNKPINDLDVAVKDINTIPKEAKEVTFQKNPDQKLYKIIIDNIEVDIGSCWKGQEDYFYKLFDKPIVVEGFNFANLKILEEWKDRMVKKYNKKSRIL